MTARARVLARGFVMCLAGAVVAAGCAGASSDAGPAAATLELECDGATTRVLGPRVRARPDGIHLAVRNVGREPLHVVLGSLGDLGEGLTSTSGTIAPGGTGSAVVVWEPGVAQVACVVSSGESIRTAYELAPDVEIVDEAGHWHPRVHAACETTGFAAAIRADARGIPGDPPEVVRAIAREHPFGFGVAPDDELTWAGYPQATLDAPAVNVVREGRTVATLDLAPFPGGWLIAAASWCSAAAGSGGTVEPA